MNDVKNQDSGGNSAQPDYVYLSLPGGRAENEASLLDYWAAVRKRMWLVILCIIVVVGAVAAIVLQMQPKYAATVSMLYVRGDSSASSSSSSSDRSGGRESSESVDVTMGSAEEAVAILKSRRFTNEFIEQNNLLPVLFAEKWNAETNEWILEPGESPPDLWDAYHLFDRKVRTITNDRVTGLTNLTITWYDPELSAEWANGLIERLNATLRERDVGYAQRSLDHLNEALSRHSQIELKETLYSLIEKMQSTIMLASVSQEYAYRIIDPAVPPKFQVWTKLKRMLAIIAAGITALMLGVFLALFVDFLDRQKPHPIDEIDDDE